MKFLIIFQTWSDIWVKIQKSGMELYEKHTDAKFFS